jgi:hypothetical protein
MLNFCRFGGRYMGGKHSQEAQPHRENHVEYGFRLAYFGVLCIPNDRQSIGNSTPMNEILDAVLRAAAIPVLIVMGIGTIYVLRLLKPNANRDRWDAIDRASEYALPCGHIRGQHWKKTVGAWCCNVCDQPDPRGDNDK